MKIAIFIDEFPIRSQTFVINQIKALIDLGHDVNIVALYQGDLDVLEQTYLAPYNLANHCIFLLGKRHNAARLIFERLCCVVFGFFQPSKRRMIIKGLSRCFKGQAKNLMLSTIAQRTPPLTFDWTIAHFGSSGVIANNLREIGLLKSNIATVFHGLDISAELSYRDTLYHYKRLFGQSEVLLPISQLWQEKLISLGAPSEKTYIHRMGIELNQFQYSPPCKLNDLCSLLCIGRFSEKKGIRYALDALASLKDKFKFHFYIVGFGELEGDIKAQIQALELTDNVTLLGTLSSEEVAYQLSQADIYLQPSVVAQNGDKEGVPVSIMEAMASGVPVVSTFHSGIPELITHNLSGLLVEERDVEALASAIFHLASSFSLRQKLSEAGLEQVKAISDLGKLNIELIEHLEECVNERK